MGYDLIALGHVIITDPDWVNKVKNNEKYSYVNESDLNKKSEYNNELNMKTDDNNVIIEKAKDLFGDINVN